MLSWAKENLPIPRVKKEDLSFEEFTKNYLSPSYPVIVENCLDGLDSKSWNLDYLKREIGGDKEIYEIKVYYKT